MDTLSDTYLRAKRYLVFFAAIQLLVCLVGLSPASENTFLGVSVAQPQYLSTVTFVIVLYYLLQLSLFWEAQNEPVKRKVQHVIDYRASAGIAFLSLAAVPISMHLSLLGINLFQSQTQMTSPPHLAHIAILYAMLPVAAGIYGFYARSVVDQRRSDIVDEQNEILTEITKNRWRLVFNPVVFGQTQGRQGSKEMVFRVGGEIAQGRNDNEDEWRVNGSFLELLDSKKRVHSRFGYDRRGKRFVHTNDDDTLSIRGQYLNSTGLVSDPT